MQSRDEKLQLLRTLLLDYSYPEKRSLLMLREIDSLLTWALSEVIQPGLSSTFIEETLGPPHLMFGEKSDDTSDWFYPVLPTPTESTRASEWFICLTFRDGILHSIDRRGWIE
jgi:hypothetical protein